MRSTMVKALLEIGCIAMFALPAVLFAQGRLSPPDRTDDRSWQPDRSNRLAYQSIVDLNIFLPDRSGLAQKLEQQDKPAEPEPPEQETVDDTPPPPPPNPDARLVLRGTSIRGNTGYVFIEDLSTGQTLRLQVPCNYAKGQFSDATIDGVIYTTDDGQTLQLNTGQTLTGELAPRGSSIARRSGDEAAEEQSTSEGESTPGGDDGLSELERRLRERRQRGE